MCSGVSLRQPVCKRRMAKARDWLPHVSLYRREESVRGREAEFVAEGAPLRGIDLATLCDVVSDDDLAEYARECAGKGYVEHADVEDLLVGADDESTRVPMLDAIGFEDLRELELNTAVSTKQSAEQTSEHDRAYPSPVVPRSIWGRNSFHAWAWASRYFVPRGL